jgi:hypothetical protein
LRQWLRRSRAAVFFMPNKPTNHAIIIMALVLEANLEGLFSRAWKKEARDKRKKRIDFSLITV